jgi:hypothetical protein
LIYERLSDLSEGEIAYDSNNLAVTPDPNPISGYLAPFREVLINSSIDNQHGR